MSSNIEVKLDVLNQKASPALYAAPLADRPAASFTGRLFVDSDSPSTGLYRDTGSTWIQVADAGAGTTGTLQQVTTNGNTTNIGISVTANGIGIGVAAPAANILDIHGTTGVLAQLENTTTQNSLLSFRNQGSGVWSIGNGYNAGANDFIVYDAVSFVNRLTIKATGQTFIGADTTSSGLLVVNSSTSDNHLVLLGANAPSIRIRNTGTSPTLNAGLGISTATNNFIQGSASGNYCLFNSSTTASPILFGIYDAGTGNTQEAIRITSSRNLLIGSTGDNGNKLQVNGTSFLSSNVGINVTPSSWGLGRAIEIGFIGNAIWGVNSTQYNIIQNGYFDSGYKYATSNPASYYQQNSGIHVWYIAAAGTAGNPITFTTAMTIKNSGVTNITNTSIYATNALALAGGLVAGDIYKSATGVLSIVF